MNKHALCVALLLAVGSTAFGGGQMMAQTSTPPHEQTQAGRVSGTVTDRNGNPLIGASVMVKGTHTGVVTDINGKFSIAAKEGQTLEISYVGYSKQNVRVGSHSNYDITLSSSTNLDEVVVTAMGVSREKKSLTYAIDEIDSEELMRNKSTNVLNSLSGKMAGVNITQASGAAGAGTQIILRGGTSLERDNQPLFVVDGVIYDNSTSIVGNSAFDGMMATATTNSNRVMDINPEDIESMSVLKGPPRKVRKAMLRSTSMPSTSLHGQRIFLMHPISIREATTTSPALSTLTPHSRGVSASEPMTESMTTSATSSRAEELGIPTSASPAVTRTVTSTSPARSMTRTV